VTTGAPAGADAGSSASAVTAGDAGASQVATGDASTSQASAGDAGASAAVLAMLDTDGGEDLSASMPTVPIPTFRPRSPPLPPPSEAQQAALTQLQHETDVYAAGARDYKDTIATVITIHYEEKKKQILSGLNAEIDIEKSELEGAREKAIAALEKFVAKYSGPNKQDEATPDAMYRLAALLEERARNNEDPQDKSTDLAITLKPAINYYKRIIREFPDYRDLPGIYFFLGYALADARRVDESQQVWRSLVCHNHFAYPVGTDPKNPDIDEIVRKPQDDDESHWIEWRRKYRLPDDIKKGPKEDVVYDDPYPADCQPLPQRNLQPGSDPKYLAEIWWRIGDWEFDQFDMKGGVVNDERYATAYAVWDFNRAASAYTHAMEFKKKPELFGIALYKHAWTEFKEQRYEAAVQEFVSLIHFTDEQEKLTGDPGANFRTEAYTYIAGSLDQADFQGPGPNDPYIERPDILGTAKTPADAEAKLKVAIERVQDPKLVPQDKPWTIEIYKALAFEFRTIFQYRNALAVYKMVLDKWPMDPSAPQTQEAVAEVFDELVKQTKIGDEKREYEKKVLEARTALAKYVGDKPWVDANKDNPGAIQAAEELVRGGLKLAAGTHTRNGQGAVDEAKKPGLERADQIRQLNLAASEYKLAADAWLAYLKQDENAPDSYRTRYFYADALKQQIEMALYLHRADPKTYAEPSSQDIAIATKAAVDVRDSDEDDEFIENAALFVVQLADAERDLAFQKYVDSGGKEGIEKREDPKLEGPEGAKKVVFAEIPPVIQRSMQARDQYIERVPPERDSTNSALEYAYYSATQYYAYGHYPDARARFQILYDQRCQKDYIGYEAWKKLLTMATNTYDTVRATKLAEADKAKSCAVTPPQLEEHSKGTLTEGVITNASFRNAREAFEAAEKEPEGPRKNKLYEIAAGMFEKAFRAAPAHKEAAKAAIDAAYCYNQIGKFNQSIDLYDLFIKNYGSEDLLIRLEKGGIDPETKKKVDPDKDQYKERIDFLEKAYQSLSRTYYGFFAYPQAAQSYGKIATNPRFDDDKRSKAANVALALYSNLGDRQNMNRMYDILVDPKMKLDADRRAEADYLRASFDYAQWSPNGTTPANTAARNAAIAAYTQFHTTARGKPAYARYALEAAYRIAKMMQSVGDPGFRNWFNTTTTDWEYFHSNPASMTGSDGKKMAVTAMDAPYNDYGGEAAYTLLDEKIHADWDYSTGHHRYKGTVTDVQKAVDKDVEELNKWQAQLFNNPEAKIKGGPNPNQTPGLAQKYKGVYFMAAWARVGTLYESIRTGFESAQPTFVTREIQGKLDKLKKFAEDLKNGTVPDKVCQQNFHVDCDDASEKIRDAIRSVTNPLRDAWRTTKEKYMNDFMQNMVDSYASAAVLARKADVKDATVQGGIASLAVYTDRLKDDPMKMKDFVERVPDPTEAGKMLVYTDGEFQRWRSGSLSTPPPNGQVPPAPSRP
jgi:hypothetical protein